MGDLSKDDVRSLEQRLNYLWRHGRRGTRDEAEFDALNAYVKRNGYTYKRPNWWSGGGYLEDDD